MKRIIACIKGIKIVVLLYVNNLFMIRSDAIKIKWLIIKLKSIFEMTNLKLLKVYFVVEFLHVNKGIFLIQCHFIVNIFNQLGMVDYKPTYISLP
jgi:hypothetical protein